MNEYVRCWTCKNWTRSDLLDMQVIVAGEVGRVCLGCGEALRERDSQLELKRRIRDGQSQSFAIGGGPAVDEASSSGSRTEPVSMDEGGDAQVPAGVEFVARDHCDRCGKVALYEYTYYSKAVPGGVLTKGCEQHMLADGSDMLKAGFKLDSIRRIK